MPVRIVIDTSVLVAAARSRNGASYLLVSQIPSSRFEFCLSLSLYLEWQEVLCRPENLPPSQSASDVQRFLRYLAKVAHGQGVSFSLRPFLWDPNDDMILELAFASASRYIVTHNIRDFRGSERLGIQAITPQDFLFRLKT